MDVLKSLKEALTKNTKPNTSNGPSTTDSKQNHEQFLSNGTYSLENSFSNWYSAQPYGFRFKDRSGTVYTMFLPISPSNLSIQTHFATNVISTLYGTVEEHSDIRYYDIVIRGTTGIAPKYYKPFQTGKEPNDTTVSTSTRSSGRSAFSMADSIPDVGGFFSQTIDALRKIRDKAKEIKDGKGELKSGVTDSSSGYAAFHNLYRFLHQYKKDTASGGDGRSSHPLTFFNYKDKNEYDVAVQNFVVERSAENPMLYNYSIQLRGYNLRNVSGDKIDNDILGKRISSLGLDGVAGSTVLGNMKKISNDSKSILGAVKAGINLLGR